MSHDPFTMYCHAVPPITYHRSMSFVARARASFYVIVAGLLHYKPPSASLGCCYVLADGAALIAIAVAGAAAAAA